MSRTGKILLGIITFMPFVFLAIYLSLFFQFFFEILKHHTNAEDAFFQLMPSFIFIGLLLASKIGLLIYYIVHALNNPRIDGTEKLVWILVFFFVGTIGFPIYWYARIWKEGGSLPPTLAGQ
jgi:predicted permease